MRRRTALCSDRGQAVLLVAALGLFFLMLLGLVSDGGMVLAQRRDLQGLADGAARAGASAVIRTATPQVLRIDTADAQAQISRYLAAARFAGSVQATPAPTQVSVDISATYPLTFARLFGISAVTLHATATSEPIAGGGS